MRSSTSLSLALAALVCSASLADEPELVVIRAARVITVSGEEFAPGMIVAKDGKIQAVGQRIEVPEGAKEFDLGERVLMPGLVAPRTRFGLRLRAVGENPASVDTAGVSVTRLRYAAVAICGVLCGLAGAYLATGLSAGFVKEMTAGRGFIALAALIFAKWTPWGALFATFLFGLLEAIANRYPNLEIGPVTIPSMFMNALPYILTVIILAGFVGRAIPPRAGGEPYVKER